MKVGLFLGMCHIFLISRGLQKNSLLSVYWGIRFTNLDFKIYLWFTSFSFLLGFWTFSQYSLWADCTLRNCLWLFFDHLWLLFTWWKQLQLLAEPSDFWTDSFWQTLHVIVALMSIIFLVAWVIPKKKACKTHMFRADRTSFISGQRFIWGIEWHQSHV